MRVLQDNVGEAVVSVDDVAVDTSESLSAAQVLRQEGIFGISGMLSLVAGERGCTLAQHPSLVHVPRARNGYRVVGNGHRCQALVL